MNETATRSQIEAAVQEVCVYEAEADQQAHRFGKRLNENILKFKTKNQHTEIKSFHLKFQKGAWNEKAEYSALVDVDIGKGFKTALQITSRAESKEMCISCIAPVELRAVLGMGAVLRFSDHYIRENLPEVKKLFHYREWVIR